MGSTILHSNADGIHSHCLFCAVSLLYGHPHPTPGFLLHFRVSNSSNHSHTIAKKINPMYDTPARVASTPELCKSKTFYPRRKKWQWQFCSRLADSRQLRVHVLQLHVMFNIANVRVRNIANANVRNIEHNM